MKPLLFLLLLPFVAQADLPKGTQDLPRIDPNKEPEALAKPLSKEEQRKKWAEEMAEEHRKNEEQARDAVKVLAEKPENQITRPLWDAFASRFLKMPEYERLVHRVDLQQAVDVAAGKIRTGTPEATAREWAKKAVEKKIVIGMPQEFVIVSWGRPVRASESSTGRDTWTYEEGKVRHYLHFTDGALTEFTKES